MLKLPQLARELVATETARLKLGLFRVVSALLILLVAAVTVIIGTVFLLSGIYQSLLQVTSAWEAGGIITLGSLVVAALLAFWARHRLSAGRRPPAADSPRVSAVVEEVREATERGITAGEEIKRGLRPIDLLLSAFIAGMIVSRSSRAASQRRKGKDDSGP